MRNIEKVQKKVIAMVQFRYITLVLALLLPLVVGLRNPTLLANKEVTSVVNNGQAFETVKEVHHETKRIADGTQGRRLRGRKIGAEDVLREDGPRSEANTGKDVNSSSNSYGTSNKKGALEPGNQSKTLHSKSQVSEAISAPYAISESEIQDQHDHSTGTQDLLHASAEIFKMMNKDYHTKARRRPPINNNLPLKDHKVVTP